MDIDFIHPLFPFISFNFDFRCNTCTQYIATHTHPCKRTSLFSFIISSLSFWFSISSVFRLICAQNLWLLFVRLFFLFMSFLLPLLCHFIVINETSVIFFEVDRSLANSKCTTINKWKSRALDHRWAKYLSFFFFFAVDFREILLIASELFLQWFCFIFSFHFSFFSHYSSLTSTLHPMCAHFTITHFSPNKISVLLKSSSNDANSFWLIMFWSQQQQQQHQQFNSNICKDEQTNRNIYGETCHRQQNENVFVGRHIFWSLLNGQHFMLLFSLSFVIWILYCASCCCCSFFRFSLVVCR